MVTKRARRWITRGVGIAVLAALVVSATATWIQAGSLAAEWLEYGPRHAAGSVTLVAVDDDQVELGGDADRAGVWGLEFDGGRMVVGEVTDPVGESVERTLLEFTGAPVPGEDLRFDRSVWAMESAEAFGLVERLVEGPDGALSVWQGSSSSEDTAVVFVHGNDAGPEESLRLARAVHASGFPVVVATYRSEGLHGYGYDEWRDVEVAIDFALGPEVRDIVLVGYGSGASIVGAVLYESRLADRVAAVVADAPTLDLGAAVDEEWAAAGVPGWLLGWTKALASFRFGVDFGAIDHVERGWDVPTLILHGRSDDHHPLETSTEFALDRPDTVRLITFPGAGTGESWNSDRDRYEAAVLLFLEEHVAGPSDLGELTADSQ